MSTQHPDNASLPSWIEGEVIQGDAEIYEAYFAYSILGCQEVMWDSEGKDVDTHVTRKLLSSYEGFFKDNALGEDVFLTYRIPNPRIEVTEKKILVESLENIPVAHDIASTFYKRDTSPIFEVILPFTTSGEELLWLLNYYKKAIVGVEDIELHGTTKVADWIGSFKPKKIEVIPLIEDMESILKIDAIVKPYLQTIKPKHMRVFIARSDPALNYGLVCAVILCKLAFSQLKRLETETDTALYPVLGVGTMPFRGHLTPDNLKPFLDEYKGLCTATIQSALKYDFTTQEVKKTVETLNKELPRGESNVITSHEEKALRNILIKFMKKYQKVVEKIAPLINSVASFVPQRRARKLHIGLFGYSRNVGKAFLPRAIPFAGALYTLGIPPEYIGFDAVQKLTDEEWDVLQTHYVNLKHDIQKVAGYLSWQNLNMLKEMHVQVAKKVGIESQKLRLAILEMTKGLEVIEENLGVKLGPKNLTQRKYENITNNFLISFMEEDKKTAQFSLQEAAKIRKCLG